MNLDDLNEKQLLKRAKSSMENINEFFEAFKDFKKEFTGTEHNPNGGFFNEMRDFKSQTNSKLETIDKRLEEVEKFKIQQKTGWDLGKWLIGTSLGAYLITQLETLQHFIRNIFK